MPLTHETASNRLASSNKVSGQHSRHLSAFFMSGIQGSQPLSNDMKCFMEERPRILPLMARVSGRVVTGEYKTFRGNSQCRLTTVEINLITYFKKVINSQNKLGIPTMKTSSIKRYHLISIVPSQSPRSTLLAISFPMAQRLACLSGYAVIGWSPVVRRSLANTVVSQGVAA